MPVTGRGRGAAAKLVKRGSNRRTGGLADTKYRSLAKGKNLLPRCDGCWYQAVEKRVGLAEGGTGRGSNNLYSRGFGARGSRLQGVNRRRAE